ncbi:hypothetical protein GIB67_007858 [Kingdonia uniflora]|uniref:Uncharacterized protein n=1 Tax=Kingdonia uniflora TaxID=39325 RepID=A0A7J7MLF6_9MAGN|nr:hypothetical protein GIB67_007858 [Kingdonia uniflora]
MKKSNILICATLDPIVDVDKVGAEVAGLITSVVTIVLIIDLIDLSVTCYQKDGQNYQNDDVSQFFAGLSVADPNWYIDLGATNHMTADHSLMNIRSNYHGSDQIMIGNGSGIPIQGSEFGNKETAMPREE